MDSPEIDEQPAVRTDVYNNPGKPRSPFSRSDAVLSPQACATCQGAAELNSDGENSAPSYIYALGRVEARFPRVSLEKEFAQVAGRADTSGKTDQETFQAVLSQRENRYLVRQLCWVMTIQGLDTYLLQPRDPAISICCSGLSGLHPTRSKLTSSSACAVRSLRRTCATA